VLLLAAAGAAQAGRPLITDDTSTLPQGACQLESWLQSGHQPTQWVLAPACNPQGDIEWGAMLVIQRAPASGRLDQLGLQAKTVFKELEVNGWGAGASLGLIRPLRAAEGPTLLAGNLMLSVSPVAPLTLHLNAGAVRAEGRHAVANWSGGVEFIVNQQWTLIADRYGERHGRPFTALGAAVWLVQDKLQLDGSVGREPRPGGYARYGTLGLVWVWENVLPAP
jgi:hypothetical protein